MIMKEEGIKGTVVVQIIGTAITIGVVIFGGGALFQRVIANETRLDRVEVSGSPTLSKHEAMDLERDRAVCDRVIRLEAALLDLQELKADIREIKTDLRNLKKP